MGVSIDMTSPSSGLSADALMDLIANPAKYKATLDELKAEQAKLDAKIALAGPAEQVVDLRNAAVAAHRNAEEKSAMADSALANAKSQAAAIVAAAQAKSAEMITAAKNSADTAMAAAAKKDAAATAHEAEVFRREMAAKGREGAVGAREIAAQDATIEAQAAKAAYETKLANLAAALKGV